MLKGKIIEILIYERLFKIGNYCLRTYFKFNAFFPNKNFSKTYLISKLSKHIIDYKYCVYLLESSMIFFRKLQSRSKLKKPKINWLFFENWIYKIYLFKRCRFLMLTNKLFYKLNTIFIPITVKKSNMK